MPALGNYQLHIRRKLFYFRNWFASRRKYFHLFRISTKHQIESDDIRSGYFSFNWLQASFKKASKSSLLTTIGLRTLFWPSFFATSTLIEAGPDLEAFLLDELLALSLLSAWLFGKKDCILSARLRSTYKFD